MINKTKIEWCTHTWNPVTGCKHGCPYCYARSIANHFGTSAERFNLQEYIDDGTLVVLGNGADALFELNAPFTDFTGNAYPFRFKPTFRRYLLGELAKGRTPKDIFVCSMADLFGDWVPLRWIRDVLDACAAAPWNRYLFLTKNPKKYDQLNQLALLPQDDNFWYGATVTTTADFDRIPIQAAGYKQFLSIEPLLARVDMRRAAHTLPKWLIVGAETGNYRPANKVTPEREWVDEITEYARKRNLPVFYKDSLRKRFPDLPPSEFPW
ncbi:MAG: DUF5131 family protein [Oscillibacter sp.]|nr:DUF5131 family protein [Oscillibacter sp.]